MNQNVVRCYYDTILTTPNAPYRKELHRKWQELYPETTHTQNKESAIKKERYSKELSATPMVTG